MSSALQNLLILAGIVLIAGLGYYLYTQNQGANLHNTQVNNQASVKTAQSLQRLQEIKSISLDGSFFSDPRFTTLLTFANDVIPEPPGKSNPFVGSH